MIYQINMRGFKPYYTSSKLDAENRYYYMKRYFTKVSLRKIPFEKALYKIYYK